VKLPLAILGYADQAADDWRARRCWAGADHGLVDLAGDFDEAQPQAELAHLPRELEGSIWMQ
jgi:hypothetical protein